MIFSNLPISIFTTTTKELSCQTNSSQFRNLSVMGGFAVYRSDSLFRFVQIQLLPSIPLVRSTQVLTAKPPIITNAR